MSACDEFVGEILRVIDDCGHGEPFRSVIRVSIEILGDNRVFAVGHAVFSQVSGAHMRRDHFQRTPAGLLLAPALSSHFPRSYRVSLPRRLGRWLRLAEVQLPGLRPSIRIDSEGVFVFPGDADPSGIAHDVTHTKRLALIPGGLVLGKIPGIGNAAAFGVKRKAGVVSLRWGDHAKAPVFGYDGHPISREIDWGAGLGLSWGLLPSLSALSGGAVVHASRERQQHDQREERHNMRPSNFAIHVSLRSTGKLTLQP